MNSAARSESGPGSPRHWRTDCAALVPCCNEEAAIARVVEGVRRHVGTVLVVDDGSSDRTADAAAKAGARIRLQGANRGKGSALQAGCSQLRQEGFRWVLTLDGDGQHSPDDIPTFFECAERTGADLVVGNRMGAPQEMPVLRRFVNRWMSRKLSRAANRPLPDSQCGFRLLDLQAWSGLQIRTRHFEIESESLLAFIRAGRRVEFVPIQVIYKTGRSKIHPLRDTLRWFRWWARARDSGAWRPEAESWRQNRVGHPHA
jgi:glycosyltransferase involved in cell wall biosynthesis